MQNELHIHPFKESDRSEWEALARGYKEFYKTQTTDAEYEAAWQRIIQSESTHGLGIWLNNELVGIAHYIFHTSTWASTVCYLQDMFVAPEHRNKGIGLALIKGVREQAKARGASRYYWLTQESNVVARALYEKVAKFGGFIRYDCAL